MNFWNGTVTSSLWRYYKKFEGKEQPNVPTSKTIAKQNKTEQKKEKKKEGKVEYQGMDRDEFKILK